jgi:hypothetical protein
MRRHSFEKIAGIGMTAVLSIPLVVLIWRATNFVTPGWIFLFYLIPPTGEIGDMRRSLAVAFSVDFILCFALILGLYSLGVKILRK